MKFMNLRAKGGAHLRRTVAYIGIVTLLAASLLYVVNPASAALANVTSDAFKLSDVYSVNAGQPTGAGSFANGAISDYPEGACVPVLIEAENDSGADDDITFEIVFDYEKNVVGIEDLESVTYNGAGTASDASDLSDFTYSEQSIGSGATFTSHAGDTITATANYLGESADPNLTTRSYEITLEDVADGDVVDVTLCGRLSDVSGDFNGASMHINADNGDIAIQVNKILELPSLTIEKALTTEDATDTTEFDFVVSYTVDATLTEVPVSVPAGGSVTVDSIPALTATDVTVTELTEDGYTFASVTCDDDFTTTGGADATVNVVADQTAQDVTCTFTNTADSLPSLTLTKVVEGGDALPDEWSFVVFPEIDGEDTFEIPDGDDTVVIPGIDVDGDYTIVEVGPEGYEFTSGTGTNCTFDDDMATASVASGDTPQNAECIFTNTALELPTLTVTKIVVNDDEGTAVIGDFTLYVDSDVVVSGDANELIPGDYVVSEDQLDGYTGVIGGDCDADGNVTLAYGDDLECTITNDDEDVIVDPDPATLTIIKVVQGTDTPVEWFDLFADDIEFESGVAQEVSPGTYTISEDGDNFDASEWDTTFSGDCDGTDEVVIASGDDAVCTITNAAVSDPTASLMITKVVDGGDAEVLDYTFEARNDANQIWGFQESGDSQDLPLDVYTVTESGPMDGYTATFGGDCDADGDVVLDQEDTSYECTITNTYDDGGNGGGGGGGTDPDPSTLTIFLEIILDDNGLFIKDQFKLFADADEFEDGVTQTVSPATYEVYEIYDKDGFEIAAVEDGYTTSFDDDCDSDGFVTVAEGDDAVCTIIINDIPEDDEEESGGGGGGADPNRDPAPEPEVLGETDTVEPEPTPEPEPEPEPAPEPRVLGVADEEELPRTGLPAGMLAIAPFLIGFGALRRKK